MLSEFRKVNEKLILGQEHAAKVSALPAIIPLCSADDDGAFTTDQCAGSELTYCKED